MCRCCQRCWEDFYWNCFEERFCYDESIANYNPEEDEEYIATQKNGHTLSAATSRSNNNHLTVPEPICQQPIRGGHANLNNLKVHEEDFRRETQTNVPMLGPEILAVFANSQIFQDHQPTKLSRINTKTHLAGVHTPNKDSSSATFQVTSALAAAAASAATSITALGEQERLIRSLEANLDGDLTIDSTPGSRDIPKTTTTTVALEDSNVTPEKRITFTLTSTDSSPSDSIQTINSGGKKLFYTISEEQTDSDINESDQHDSSLAKEISASDELILRPRLVQRHPTQMQMQVPGSLSLAAKKRSLRTVKSVPHLNVRGLNADLDVFSITGSQMSISMTPEVPSISFGTLPKNYEDTPTIEKYRVSQSLYAIQTANAARALQYDYSMPRYFRRSGALTQSNEMLNASASSSRLSDLGGSKEEVRRPDKKSKRLQALRSNLPPLLIHSVSFSRKRVDESKQLD